MIRRLFALQLREAAETITHRRRIQAVASGADQVMLAVADHQRIARLQFFLGDQVGDQLDLVGPGAVQLAAVDHLEVPGKIEMPGNLAGEHPGLGRGDVQGAALSAEGFQQGRDPIEHPVFIQPGDLETLAVEIHRFPGPGLVETVELHERLQQRWPDKVFELAQVRLVDAQLAEGVLDRAGDALARVGQGAVEVEQNRLVVHEIPQSVQKTISRPDGSLRRYADP